MRLIIPIARSLIVMLLISFVNISISKAQSSNTVIISPDSHYFNAENRFNLSNSASNIYIPANSVDSDTFTSLRKRGAKNLVVLDDEFLSERISVDGAISGKVFENFARVTFITTVSDKNRLSLYKNVVGGNFNLIYINPNFERRLIQRTLKDYADHQDAASWDIQYDYPAALGLAVKQIQDDSMDGSLKPWSSGVWMAGVADGLARLKPADNESSTDSNDILAALRAISRNSQPVVAPMWKSLDPAFQPKIQRNDASESESWLLYNGIIRQTCDDWKSDDVLPVIDEKWGVQPFGLASYK